MHMRTSSRSAAAVETVKRNRLKYSVVEAMRSARVYMALAGQSNNGTAPTSNGVNEQVWRENVFQGETLTVVVQLDVSAEYHAHVLRPLRELECQVLDF